MNDRSKASAVLRILSRAIVPTAADSIRRNVGSIVMVASLVCPALGPAADDVPLSDGFALGETQVVTEMREELSPPAIEFNTEGALHAAWFERRQGTSSLVVSRIEKGPASASVRANPLDMPPGALHQAPGLAIGRQGRVYATWTTPKGDHGSFAGDLMLARSTDGGTTFESPIVVNDDAQLIGHSFETIAAGPGDNVYVGWLDDRHKNKSGAGVLFARSSDAGKTIEANVTVDGMACPCCRPASAIGPDGDIWLSWRKTFEGNVRDIVLARAQDGTLAFPPPVLVHEDGWVFSACPHRGPSLGFDKSGRLYVAWYTEGTDETPRLMFATSDDEGKTFSAPILLHTAENSLPDQLRMAVHPNGMVVAVWEEITGVRKRVVTRISTDRGKTFGKVQAVSGQAKAQNPTAAIHENGTVAIGWNEHEWPHNRVVVRWGRFGR